MKRLCGIRVVTPTTGGDGTFMENRNETIPSVTIDYHVVDGVQESIFLQGLADLL